MKLPIEFADEAGDFDVSLTMVRVIAEVARGGNEIALRVRENGGGMSDGDANRGSENYGALSSGGRDGAFAPSPMGRGLG